MDLLKFFEICLLISLKGTFTEREGDKEVFYLLVRFLNGSSGWLWARLK